MFMKRRSLLQMLMSLPLVSVSVKGVTAALQRRVRPGDRAWPSKSDWDALNRTVGGRLMALRTPLRDCVDLPASPACAALFNSLRNPYFIGEEPGLTQTLGWVDAWTFAPSVFAVAANNTADVVAAVNFARQRNLRLVVKGGGHSYQGTSNAADSLLVWTRRMNAITVHASFVPVGCTSMNARPAVSVQAGAIWMQVYDAVTTRHGRYVQGGGCTTVGVAGLVQSGGFGSFSKRYGSAAASLLEAEIVTADGQVRIANARENPDLFWGIKGGGGGALGVITRLTLETHELAAAVGGVNVSIRANSDAAFRTLIGNVLAFYRDHLLNPSWGEQIVFKARRVLTIDMVFQGMDREAAAGVWKGFFDDIANSPNDYSFVSAPSIEAFPARKLWNTDFLKQIPGIVKFDDRPGAAAGNMYWAGDGGQCGQVLHGYDSVWLPSNLLDGAKLQEFADVLYAAATQWQVSLHVNKGLAGAPPSIIEAARNTATNPAVLGAFALAIIAAEEPPAYPGIAGHEPNVSEAHADAAGIHRAMAELRKVVPEFASYVAESNFFEKHWQRAFWGANYPKLLAVKLKYDPGGLFFTHHGAGSEAWSADGFTRAA